MPLPEPISTRIATTVLTQVLGGTLKHFAGQDAGKVAKVNNQWQEGVTGADHREPQRVEAFQLFFEMKDTKVV